MENDDRRLANEDLAAAKRPPSGIFADRDPRERIPVSRASFAGKPSSGSRTGHRGREAVAFRDLGEAGSARADPAFAGM
jgi:hypothetical protein